MPARKKPVETPAAFDAVPEFDLALFRESAHYVIRDIPREDDEPLRVRVRDLSIRQTNAIPWGVNVPLRESFEHVAQYVVEWNLCAENVETGETVAVPPPAVVGWEVFELLPNSVGSDLVNWLKVPFFMKAEAEKKALTPSTSTTDPPKSGG